MYVYYTCFHNFFFFLVFKDRSYIVRDTVLLKNQNYSSGLKNIKIANKSNSNIKNLNCFLGFKEYKFEIFF